MSERYATLFRCTVPQSQKHSPVLLSAGVLLGDRQTGSILAQIKFQNIGDQCITAVYASLMCVDAMNVLIDQPVEARYLDLNVKPGEFFADRQPIVIANTTVRSFALRITNIMFADGTVWKNEEGTAFEVIPAFENAYTTEQLEQLRLETGKQDYVTSEVVHECIRRCYCSQWNMLANRVCVKCHCDFAEAAALADPLSLSQKYNERKTAERSKLYDAVLKTMQEAGEDSQKWRNVCSELSNPELDGYRDVGVLRQKAEARRVELRQKAEAHRVELRQKAEAHRVELQQKAEARRVEAAREKRRALIASLTTVTAVVVVFLLATKVIIPKGHYDAAMRLRTNEQWEEAVAEFVEAGSYSDAAEQVYATYYNEGETKREAGDWDGAVTAFTKADKYNGAKAQITETYYQRAQSLMESGNYNQAYALFVTLKGYADVDSLLSNDENLLAAARDAMFAVGNYVTFGTYPQTSSGSDETPIEWLVLERDGNNVLLLSRYGLDAQPYNKARKSITWEGSTLRTWLNDDFMNRAFTAEEQAAILLTNVDNGASQGYSQWYTRGSNNTQDKIFLLSYAEANRYLDITYTDGSNTQSRVAPTAYAVNQGAWTSGSKKTSDGEAVGWWWLRSPGSLRNFASYVSGDGSLNNDFVTHGNGSVRPALWVNLEALVF